MRTNLLNALLILIILTNCISCDEKNPNTLPSETATTEVVQQMKVKAFNNVDNLVSTLSENGIGTLKPWQNPFDSGYGSLTNYYPIGTAQVEYGLPNNIAYYLEGTETTAKNLMIVLNINNPNERKVALAYLGTITAKTFKSLNLEPATGLIKAIRLGKVFKEDNSDFSTAFTLEQSKIETWKVSITSK